MAERVLISGASGLIGSRLSELLTQRGHEVVHLGRTLHGGPVRSVTWDINAGTLSPNALDGVTAIVHLAGAGVADKRWTEKRKKELLDSRVRSTELLAKELQKKPNSVTTFVGASAIGYYGEGGVFTEESPPGSDFLAGVTKAWENSYNSIAQSDIRLVKIRIGLVLGPLGGMLQSLSRPIRFGVGAPLGTGTQMQSWIHIDDICGIFIMAIEDKSMRGTFNGVAPKPVTNGEMTSAIAKVLKKPLWLPPIPIFALRLVLGEMVEAIVAGAVVSSEKIERSGFRFQYPTLSSAVQSLFA